MKHSWEQSFRISLYQVCAVYDVLLKYMNYKLKTLDNLSTAES